MAFKYANNAVSSLANGIGTTDTSITLVNGGGAKFPAITAPDMFYATLSDAASNTIIEIVLVTARAGDILTVLRGQDNTTAQSFILGDVLSQRGVAAEFTDFLSSSNGGTITANLAITGNLSIAGLSTLGVTTVTTPTTGDSSTRVASTAFVSATAFNAALPSQAGNAGKFVTTDGTNASFVAIAVPIGSVLYINSNFGGF